MMEHLKSPLAQLCRQTNGDWWVTIWFKGETKHIDLTEDKVFDWIERAKAKGYNVLYREDPYVIIKKKGSN